MIRDNREIICYNFYINAAVHGDNTASMNASDNFAGQADNGKERKTKMKKKAMLLALALALVLPGF